MAADSVRLEMRSSEDRLPVILRVEGTNGFYTPGPFVSVEAGNEIEMTPEEFRWLIEVAGPRALQSLGAPGEHDGRPEQGHGSVPLATAVTADQGEHGGPVQPKSPPPASAATEAA